MHVLVHSKGSVLAAADDRFSSENMVAGFTVRLAVGRGSRRSSGGKQVHFEALNSSIFYIYAGYFYSTPF